jgi:hypothetical protein
MKKIYCKFFKTVLYNALGEVLIANFTLITKKITMILYQALEDDRCQIHDVKAVYLYGELQEQTYGSNRGK